MYIYELQNFLNEPFESKLQVECPFILKTSERIFLHNQVPLSDQEIDIVIILYLKYRNDSFLKSML